MNVLLLPVNIASDISHKVRALRSIGVNARGFTIAASTIQTASDIDVFHLNKGNRITIRLRQMVAFARMRRIIDWADILHWISDANIFAESTNREFLLRANKPGVVQWMGSDIRVPEKDFVTNEFYRDAFREGYEYSDESSRRSSENQKFFADLGFYPLEIIGMGHYIDDRLFPKRYRAWQSVVLSEHVPKYPSSEKAKPLVVHSPSAPVAKGTAYILRAIEKLKSKYEFEFVLVENLPREKALDLMRECDIYIDQLIGGGHGFAAVEAMAFGKPVICYINPVIGRNYPYDLPIVNANPDNIAEQLEPLIKSAELRYETGERSRMYVEKYHDDSKIARDLVKIYEEVIGLHKRK